MTRAFAGRVVWITGASAGLGAAMARELAAQGACLVLSARREDRLHALAAELEAAGAQALVAPCDVTQEDHLRRAVAMAVERFGALHVAVANAGFGVAGKVSHLSLADWRRQFDTNVFAAALTARFAMPELEKTRGQVVFVASVAHAVWPSGYGAYGASKAALRIVGLTCAAEAYAKGVSCTVLHPGFVASEIGQVNSRGEYDPTLHDPRPQALMWPTQRAARVMVRAIAKRKREYVFTAHGRLVVWAARYAPWLVHWVLRRPARR